MKKMKKWILSILAISMIMVLSVGLFACDNGKNPDQDKTTEPVATGDTSDVTEPETPDETGAPAVKTKTELNVATLAEPTQLDPHVSNGADAVIFSAIFDSLVVFDGGNQMKVLPSLAERWEISDDQMEYTFHLVETNWHNGEPFTADDVVFSIERLITEEATSSKVLMIEGAEAIDEHTVKVKCKYAYPNLLLQMASWPWRIVSKDVVEEFGSGNAEMAIGTGPYKLDSWTPGVGMTLVSNKDYFKGEPYFEKINIKLMTDQSTTLVALENGEVDQMTVTSGFDAQYVRDNDDLDLLEVERSGAYTIIMNTQANEALAKKEVRQAFNHAIDQDALVQLVWQGEAIAPCYTIQSEGEEGYTEDIPKYEFDTEKAKALLADAGYPDGITVKFTYPATDLGERLAAAVKDMLAQSNITIDPVPMEYSAYLMAGYTGDYETIYMEWQSVPYNMPLVYNLYFISQGSLNYPRINNPEIDELAAKASVELDDDTRVALFEELHKITREEAYYAPIAYIQTNIAVNKHLKGLTFEPNTMITHFSTWYWDE